MELLTVLPDWIVWCAAGAAGAVALSAVAGMIETALDF